MPLTPEEPTIHKSVPEPRAAAGTTRTPQAPRSTAPLPGPRNSPRPAPPRGAGNRPGPGRSGPGRGAAPSGGRAKPAPPAGARIELVAATEATAVETADEAVDRLLDEGRAPGDVLLLTTGETHPWAQHEMSFGEDSYWRQLTDGDDVFCADAASADRLDRRAVVVLAVNGGTDAQVAEALPAALARATAQLIVCGDPDRLRALL